MIFGKTYEEKNDIRGRNRGRLIEYMKNPHRLFAWLPTRLTNGQIVWLDFFWERAKYDQDNDFFYQIKRTKEHEGFLY